PASAPAGETAAAATAGDAHATPRPGFAITIAIARAPKTKPRNIKHLQKEVIPRAAIALKSGPPSTRGRGLVVRFPRHAGASVEVLRDSSFGSERHLKALASLVSS